MAHSDLPGSARNTHPIPRTTPQIGHPVTHASPTSTSADSTPLPAGLRAIIDRGRRRHGERFDASALLDTHASIRLYAGTDTRVIIEATYDDGTTWRRAGRISVTTGWKPALLVMYSTAQMGSSDTVSPRDKVIAVQHSDGRYYRGSSGLGERVSAPRGTLGEYTEATTPTPTAQNV